MPEQRAEDKHIARRLCKTCVSLEAVVSKAGVPAHVPRSLAPKSVGGCLLALRSPPILGREWRSGCRSLARQVPDQGRVDGAGTVWPALACYLAPEGRAAALIMMPGPRTGILNCRGPSLGFPAFWAAYPGSERRRLGAWKSMTRKWKSMTRTAVSCSQPPCQALWCGLVGGEAPPGNPGLRDSDEHPDRALLTSCIMNPLPFLGLTRRDDPCRVLVGGRRDCLVD